MGDAVTGINRADTASGKLNGVILRQRSVLCNFSGYGAGGQPSVCPRAVSARLTTDCHAALLRAAYPPPRESCVRGADRATVDKPCELFKLKFHPTESEFVLMRRGFAADLGFRVLSTV